MRSHLAVAQQSAADGGRHGRRYEVLVHRSRQRFHVGGGHAGGAPHLQLLEAARVQQQGLLCAKPC